MNYYEPLQRQTDRRWDYTQRRDGRTWPVGYCRGWDESTREALVEQYGEDRGEMFHQAQEERRPHRDRYHEEGHETSEEACECYKRYLLDNRVNLEFGTSEDTQHRCEYDGCETWTQKLAMVDHRSYHLCDDHRNVESLRELVVVGTSMGSY
jgi:hypothetical protein